MSRSSRASVVSTLAFAAFAATTMTACTDSTSPAPAAAPARAVAIAGYQQAVTVGTTGSDSLAVVIYGADGEASVGTTVQWALVDGKGTLSSAASVTDRSGIAKVAFTAPTAVGSAHVVASVGATAAASFEETIVAGAPARLVAMRLYSDTVTGGGEGYTGTQVKVIDQYGNAVSNVEVSVAVEAAIEGDVLENSSLVTDDRGFVSASFFPADATGDRVLVFSTNGGLSLSYRLAVIASTPATPPAPPTPPTL